MEEYRYAGKRSRGNEACYIHMSKELPNGGRATYEFKAYPNWRNWTYKLYPADQMTRRKFPNPHIVSMDLIREYAGARG